MEANAPPTPRDQLITVLQMAYSGELAAGYAYRGHWQSVRDSEERAHIKDLQPAPAFTANLKLTRFFEKVG